MTWSIIARDASGAFGVAIATRFFAVGALCPHAQSGVGALSTQALVNPHYGAQGLELLRDGVRRARGGEAPDRARRGPRASAAARHRRRGPHRLSTPARQCVDWCGAVAGEGFSVAGNMLANEHVIQQTARAFHESQKAFRRAPDRRARGGRSRRRRQARQAVGRAAHLLHRGLPGAEPAGRRPRRPARRAAAASTTRRTSASSPSCSCSPSKARPWGVLDRAVIEQEIARHKKPA